MDRSVLLAINGLRTPWLDAIARPLDDWGIYVFLFAPLLILALKWRGATRPERLTLGRHARDGMLTWFLVIYISERLIKPLIRRPRPTADRALKRLLHVLGKTPGAKSLSFPSGTATACFGLAVFMWLRYGPRVGGPMLALAVVVSMVRIYAGVHFPTDILAGAALGALLGWGFSKLGDLLDARRAPETTESAASDTSDAAGA